MTTRMYVYSDELYHHGILGQKWGVRRFQNKDGSLTAAGAQRYGVDGKDTVGRKAGQGDGSANAVSNRKKGSTGKKVKRVAREIGKEFVLGSAYHYYNDEVAKGTSRGKAYVNSLIFNTANMFTGGVGGLAYDINNGYLPGQFNDKDSRAGQRRDRLLGVQKYEMKKAETQQKKRIEAYNRAAEKFNNSKELDELNKKWEGKYNTPEYWEAFSEEADKFLEKELKDR